jgi:hypothetical protein
MWCLLVWWMVNKVSVFFYLKYGCSRYLQNIQVKLTFTALRTSNLILNIFISLYMFIFKKWSITLATMRNTSGSCIITQEVP